MSSPEALQEIASADTAKRAKDRKIAKRKALVARILITFAALAIWFWTQSLLGARISPTEGIGDGLHRLTAPLNAYLHGAPRAANALLIASSALIDAIGGGGRAIAVSTQQSRSTNNTVTRALEYVRGQKWGGLQVTDMADAAEVTSRTLLRMFRQQLDLGPASYLKLRQLNIVRRELRGKHAPARKITDIMGEHGVKL